MNSTEEQIALRVKVAELRGWTDITTDVQTNVSWGYHPGTTEVTHIKGKVPNFESDLNTCAEMLRIVVGIGWVVAIRNNHFSKPWTCLFWKDGVCKRGDAEELAEAICRAFATTVEASDPQGADSVQTTEEKL